MERKENKDPEGGEFPISPNFNDRGPLKCLKQCHNEPETVYSPTDIALETDFIFWTSQIKQLLRKTELLEEENYRLRSEIGTLSNKVGVVEKDNSSLKNQLQECRELLAVRPSVEALQA